jgi:6-phosphogluconolactonase (cycloisomerase 2 family)
VDPLGKFVYISNGVSNCAFGNIWAYTVNAGSGALTVIPGSPLRSGDLRSLGQWL